MFISGKRSFSCYKLSVYWWVFLPIPMQKKTTNGKAEEWKDGKSKCWKTKKQKELLFCTLDGAEEKAGWSEIRAQYYFLVFVF